jgi:NADH-ubiquinone oxidoreductase chain 5
MEGATPVSALIHSATLVSAGVFLIIRCSPLFELSNIALLIITLSGGLTSVFASSIAITQDDVKKIIAYSTCSQLGYMVFICGLSEYNISLFHLVNHAFFKALLFLSSGVIIHTMLDEQDIRKFGGIPRLMPFVYGIFLIGCTSLCAIPFLSGFYSKDLVLEIAFSKYSIKSLFSY